MDYKRFYKRKHHFKKEYRNPFIKSKKRPFANLISAKKNTISVILLILVFSGWMYVLFYKDYLDVKYIIINGTEIIDPSEIINLVNDQKKKNRYFILPQKNIFLFSENQLSKNLNNKFGLTDLNIEINYLDRYIQINLKERESVLAYVINDKYYFLDLYGYAITETTNEELTGEFPIVFNLIENKDIELRQNVLPKVLIESMLKIKESLQNKNINIVSFNIVESSQISVKTRIEEVEVEVENDDNDLESTDEAAIDLNSEEKELDEEKKTELVEIIEVEKEDNPDYSYFELNAITKDGWQIYFGHELFENNDSLDNQINKLLIVLKEKIPDDEIKYLKYIDLRFGERIYYR